MEKPRLIFLTSRFPYPLYGGDALRVFKLAEALSSCFDVELIGLHAKSHVVGSDEINQLLQPNGPFVRLEFVEISRFESIANALVGFIFRGLPLQVGLYKSKKFQRLVSRRTSKADILLAHLIRTAQYGDSVSLPKILEYTDALSLFYRRVKLLNSYRFSIKKLAYIIEEKRVQAYEIQKAKEFDLLTFAGKTDKEWVDANDPTFEKKSIAAVNGTQLPNFHDSSIQSDNCKIAFIGNMRTLQNKDAVFFFIRDILPLLLRVDENFEFIIIGPISERLGKRLEGFRGVKALGPIADMAPVLAECCVGVCPVRIGAGVQNKVLDYLAHSLPTVSTKLGLAGLGDRSQWTEVALQAEAPSEFAEAILRIKNNTNLRRTLASNGYKLVEDNFNWENNLQPVVKRALALMKQTAIDSK